MTSPSDPRVIQQVPTAPVADEAVVATAKKLVRVRSFTKSAFEKVGVPVAIGAVTGLVVTRANQRRLDNDETVDVSSTDE